MYNTLMVSFDLFFTGHDISEGLSANTRTKTCKPSHSHNKQAAKLPKAGPVVFCTPVARRLVLAAAANVM